MKAAAHMAAMTLAIGLIAGAGTARAGTEVDLQLVLAVDSSASVDAREFALQMSGIANAFRDPQVIAAIRSGPHARIGVSLMIWAESGWPTDATPWRIVSDGASAERFAQEVEAFPRSIEGGTGIGSAVMRAVRMIEDNGLESRRRTIDVSGDGRETTFREWRVAPGLARVVATSRGITVNGLAILTDEPDLDSYYWAEVSGGHGSFVIAADTIEDFAWAMRNKLIREIEYRPVVSRVIGRGTRSGRGGLVLSWFVRR